MAKKLGLQQILRDRRGVDGNEGLVGPWTVAMQGPRHQLLAGTRLTGNEHGRMRQGEATDGAKDLLHRWRLPENLGHQALFLRRTSLVH